MIEALRNELIFKTQEYENQHNNLSGAYYLAYLIQKIKLTEIYKAEVDAVHDLVQLNWTYTQRVK